MRRRRNGLVVAAIVAIPFVPAVLLSACNSAQPTPIPTPPPCVPSSYLAPVVAYNPGLVQVTFPIFASSPACGVTTGTFDVPLPGQVRLTRVWSFIGVDSGNLGEFALDVSSNIEGPLYRRSFHKETLDAYDAWEFADVSVLATDLEIGLSTQFVEGGRVHYGLVFEYEESE